MQNAPARKMLYNLFHLMGVKLPENINAMVGAKKNVNRRLIHRAVHGNLICNLRLNQMVIFCVASNRSQCETRNKDDCFHNGVRFGLRRKLSDTGGPEGPNRKATCSARI